MKNLRFMFVLGVASCIALSFTCFKPDKGNALEFQIVKLRSQTVNDTEELRIVPDPVEVTKGTVVIWLNSTQGHEVKVVFEEGKRCADVTAGARGFSYDSAWYVTTWVPVGGTTSLQFNEPGAFEYIVEAEGM